MAKLRASVFVLVPLAVAALGSGAAPPLLAKTHLVEIPAVVVDDQGDPVVGLQREDFQVQEDGQTLSLASVKAVDAGDAASPDARLVVVLLGGNSELVKEVARRIVSRMTGADVVAVLDACDGAATTTTDVEAAMDQVDAIGSLACRTFGNRLCTSAVRASLLWRQSRIALEAAGDCSTPSATPRVRT